MDIVVVFFAALLLIIIFIAIICPVLIVKWRRRLRKKAKLKAAKQLLYGTLAVYGLLIYGLVGIIWPYDRFYRKAFYESMNLPFPDKGKIVHKITDWDVVACAIEVDSPTFKNLLTKLPGNCIYADPDSSGYNVQGVTDHYNMKAVTQSHIGTTGACVAFLNDYKTIIYLSGEILPVDHIQQK